MTRGYFESRDELADRMEAEATQAREALGIPTDVFVDIVDLLRRLKILGRIAGVNVVDEGRLPGVAARWIPETKTIELQRSVQKALENGDGRARFTIVHEIAHCWLGHTNVRNRNMNAKVSFGRKLRQDEAEANAFAIAFLCPRSLANVSEKSKSEELIAKFGLSAEAASNRHSDLMRAFRLKNGVSRQLPTVNVGIDISVNEEDDNYAEYMRSVLRQAIRYPGR